MDIGDDIGARQAEQLVVALDTLSQILEPLSSELSFTQIQSLNHGAHGTIQKDDSLIERVHQTLAPRVSHTLGLADLGTGLGNL